jgi:xanthine dehydrogenase accessory factor
VKLVGRLGELASAGGRGVLFTVVEGEGAGSKLLVVEGGETVGDGPAELARLADDVQRGGRNRLLELDGRTVFAEVYGPPPRLFVYGAVDTAEALCRGAALLGWTSIVADARATFATRERIPSADELIVAWPEEALAQVAPDHQTAVVVLTHDDKFDEPALQGALATDAFYVGALGSRRNQERRRERLREAGVDDEALDRIHGPCGLDVGADTQAETALSILAEILAVRAGRSGGPLREAKQRIHAEVD